MELIQKYGDKHWNAIAAEMGTRTGKGCSHRWGPAPLPHYQQQQRRPQQSSGSSLLQDALILIFII
jgi:hypothetical protein